MTLDLFLLEVNGQVYGPDEAMPVLKPGDQVQLTLGALGREGAFSRAQRLYQYHKADESALSVTAAFKQRHPMANREAQPIHEHGLQLVTWQPGATPQILSSYPSLIPHGLVLQATSVKH